MQTGTTERLFILQDNKLGIEHSNADDNRQESKVRNKRKANGINFSLTAPEQTTVMLCKNHSLPSPQTFELLTNLLPVLCSRYTLILNTITTNPIKNNGIRFHFHP